MYSPHAHAQRTRDLLAVIARTMRPIGLVSSSNLYGSDGSCGIACTIDVQNIRTGPTEGDALGKCSCYTFKYSCDSSRTRLSRASYPFSTPITCACVGQ
jgi:hypothetical protein